MTTPDPASNEAETPAEHGESAGRARLKRENPKRSGPIRNATGYFRHSRSWEDGAPNDAMTPDGDTPVMQTLDDVITHGVQLGYKVVEAHLEKGQRAARDLRDTPRADDEEQPEWNVFLGRAQRLYQDIGTLCLDAVDALAMTPGLLRTLARNGQNGSDGESASTRAASENHGGHAPRLSLDIQSEQRVRVDLRWFRVPSAEPLSLYPLCAADPTYPPITQACLRQDANGNGPLLLEIRVPKAQPPALYSGVVIGTETGEPIGTLVLRVFAATDP